MDHDQREELDEIERERREELGLDEYEEAADEPLSDERGGEIKVTAFSGSRQLTLESTTVSTHDEPVKFYRVDSPPIFCGFQVPWIDGEGPDGMTYDLNAGPGFGSKYMTLSVKIPGRETVYEVVDITQVLKARLDAITKEVFG